MLQLGPTYQELGPYIDIELVPFGKSVVNNQFKILKMNIIKSLYS